MTDLGGVFGQGKEAASQLFIWQVMGQLVGALMEPLLNAVTRAVNETSQTTPLSPEQLADMVVRNFISLADGSDYAKQSGIAPADFQRMVYAAGDAPGPTQLVEMLRRQIIPATGTGGDVVSFQQGIAEGRLLDKWADPVQALGDVPLGVADAVDAVVEGQIDQATGAAEAYKNGVSADNFQILVNTRGNPPSVTELLELNRRGLIPLEGVGPAETTVQQGIYEGATKDKWWQLLAQLGNYIPPPRTVTAMVRAGSIDDATALQLWKDAGLSDTLAQAYLTDAHKPTRTTTPAVTASEVSQLYEDGLVSQTQAEGMLTTLGYSTEDAQAIVSLAVFNTSKSQLTSATSRIRTLYISRKITRATAAAALSDLHVAPAQVTAMLDMWDVDESANVKVLTEAQVADAYEYALIDQPTATNLLQGMGYSAWDAWLLLSVKMKAPQGAPPPMT